MGRWSTFPTLYDDLKTLSISDLKRLGYLQNGYRKGNIRWTFRGKPNGDVDIAVWLNEGSGEGTLTFTYIFEKQRHYNYQVQLVAVPSNLGAGQRWYFICPRTGKRCIKLYMANEYFQHRDGIPGAMYQSQTKSKFYRKLEKFFGGYDLMSTPNLKRHYRGRPTKRYLRAFKAAQDSQRLSRYVLAKL